LYYQVLIRLIGYKLHKDRGLPAMKKLIFISSLCLLSTVSQATFETEEPSQMLKDFESEVSESGNVESAPVKAEVIVPANTDLYIPSVANGECDGWSLDKSEPYLDETQQTKFTTRSTYIGHAVKTINCTSANEEKTLALLLIKTTQGRLIWIESGKELSSD